MKAQRKTQLRGSEEWQWPIDITQYDRNPALSTAEYAELNTLVSRFDAGGHGWHRQAYTVLHRLLQPLYDTLDVTGAHKVVGHRASARTGAIHLVIRAMHRLHLSFWAFTPEHWIDILGTDSSAFVQRNGDIATCRQHLVAVIYLLCGFQDLKSLGRLEQYALAIKVFGKERVDAAIQSIEEELKQWGYGKERTTHYTRNALCEALLANRSPRLEDVTTEALDAAYHATDVKYIKQGLVMLSNVLYNRSLIARPLEWATQKKEECFQNRRALKDVPIEWAQWCQRWYETSTWQPSGRVNALYRLLQTGRWLAHVHPEVTSPEQWTREVAAEYVASVDRMTVGQWSNPGKQFVEKLGKPFGATSKEKHLESMRVFFRDCQEWGWLPLSP